MADKKKKPLKMYKTEAGAQQGGDAKSWEKLGKTLEKDIKTMSDSAFKDKYGTGKLEAQSRIYAGESASRAKALKDKGSRTDGIDEEYWDKSLKTMRSIDKLSRLPKAKNYAKGGYANCGASMKPDGKRRK